MSVEVCSVVLTKITPYDSDEVISKTEQPCESRLPQRAYLNFQRSCDDTLSNTVSQRIQQLGLENETCGADETQCYLSEETDEGSEDSEPTDFELLSTRDRSPTQRSRSPIDWITDGADSILDSFAEAIHFVEHVGKTIFHQHSIEGPPENNIHMLHPMTQHAIPFGVHATDHAFGCQIRRVIEGGLALKAKLEHGDIIRKINDRDLKDDKLEDIMKLFSQVDMTKTIKLRIVRQHRNENGDYTIYEIDITITLKLNDDEVTFEVETVVTATYLRYQSTTRTKYISQSPINESIVYLRLINGDRCEMSTQLDNKSQFKMELYQGGSGGRRVCVIRHQSSSKFVITRCASSSNDRLHGASSSKPNRKTIKYPDSKFFYWMSHPSYPGKDVFESLAKEKYYITVAANNSLVLRHFDSIHDVDSSGRFAVITK